YYDNESEQWVKIGGKVSDDIISVEVDHLTMFAVMLEEDLQYQEITDITGHWAEAGIRELLNQGAVSGYPDGTFRPDNMITRAEFVTILVKACEFPQESSKVFEDTSEHWARDNISTAVHHEIVTGYDSTTFGPDDPVTREQIAVMIDRTIKPDTVTGEITFADSSNISDWAREAVAAAVNKGIIRGYPDNSLRPKDHATRAEAVTVIVNAIRAMSEM
ncbi:MAG: S-layer homology domain-containing protein, partial [Thermoanaerobacterales bacterium]|nr:S-layer homology domain-containing protein [Thermoanaerobacterales bacterium]